MAGQLALPFYPPRLDRVGPSRSVRAIVRAKRLAPAAIRIPDQPNRPFDVVFPAGQPQLFVHEGARQALERKLSAASSTPTLLAITDNRHSMVRHARTNGVLRVRLHHMFLDAPAEVQSALVRYVVHGDPSASQFVGRYINANLHRIRACRRGRVSLLTRGEHHDLLAVLDSLNGRYFDGQVEVAITWGHPRRRRSAGPRKTIKLGTYSAAERMISIHPALDRAWVPRYFVAFVVYHEMLHHVFPPSRGARRAILHTPALRERETAFRHYDRAVAWEHSHIGRLLRSA